MRLPHSLAGRTGLLAIAVAAAALVPTASAAGAPSAADFTRAVPLDRSVVTTAAVARGERSTIGVDTITLRPGREFEIVGFRWRGREAPDIWASSLGSRGWSEWVKVDTEGEDRPDRGGLTRERVAATSSGPVWTGTAAAVRVRVRGKGFSSLRAHFVDVDGGALATAGARAARSAATGGVSPSAGQNGSGDPGRDGGGPRTSDAGPPPAFVTREQWGGDKDCKPRATPVYGEVLGVAIHHTVSTNGYSRAQAPGVVLGICRYHRNSNKWNELGYNALVDRFGTIYEGRSGGLHLPVIGAHAQGYNGQTAGIALIGTYSSARPTAAQLAATKRLVKWKLTLHGITRNERVAVVSTGGDLNRYKDGTTVWVRPVSGHRDFDATSCPGGSLYARLKTLAPHLRGGSRKPPAISFRLSKSAQPDGGESTVVTGRLTTRGTPLPGQAINVQALTVGGWIKLADARTDDAGLFSVTLRPATGTYLRAAFAGSSGVRPIRSAWTQSPRLRAPGATPATP